MQHKLFPLLPFIFLISAVFLPACANYPDSPARQPDEAYDPWESFNRQSFDTNYFLDRLLWRPLAELYRATIPPGIRDRVADVVENMKEPVILANNLMQGELKKAGITAARFGINTTLGIGGMWDVAGEWDLRQQTGDFGQTLAAWGVDGGPYLVLPLFGPSNLRDTLGLGVDIALSPWQYLALADGMPTFVRYEAASFGADALVRRDENIENIDALRVGSLDPYARMRSVYQQRRNQQTGGAPPANIPEFEAE